MAGSKMNHRERVLTALHHKEPDRVPIDLGGNLNSGIMAVTYRGLRERLGLEPRVTCVTDTMQQLAVVEKDVRDVLGVDTYGIYCEPHEWRPGNLTDGSPAMLPAKWNPQVQEDGSQVVFDPAGNATMKMPHSGFYFDPVHSPVAAATRISDLDEYEDWIKNHDACPFYLDKSYEELAQKAKGLRENTDYFIGAFFGAHIFFGGLDLRGVENFMIDLAVDPRFAGALMDRLVDGHMERFEHFARTLGKYVDVIEVDDDLGMQDRPWISLEMYRKMIKPRQKRMFEFIKSNCDAYLLFHSDGSIYQFIPDLIEVGVDILNPVQFSAKDMDTRRLKREFGRELTFWGGGCDTQRVLPFGTPCEVREEVKRRIDDLAPGGGFVFTQVHNIQAGSPVENVVAMYEAALEYGIY